jgi:hypothetical protein
LDAKRRRVNAWLELQHRYFLMKFSAFSKFSSGLRFSSRPSAGETFYRQLSDGESGAFAVEPGTRNGARLFATAMAFARLRYNAERCGNQMFADTVEELLPVQEKKYGLSPRLTDTIAERRAALAVAKMLPNGNNVAAVSALLSAALGSDFLCYRVTKPAEIIAYPANPATNGNWPQPGYPSKVGILAQNLSVTGSPVPVIYTNAVPGDTAEIAVGESVIVGANNITQAEKVTATLIGEFMPGVHFFLATLTKAHEAGDIVTTGPFPYWVSTQLHSLVVVTPACAVDADKRRLINNIMRNVVRGVSTWDIAPSTDGLHTDAFKTDDAVLGRTGYATIGTVAFP